MYRREFVSFDGKCTFACKHCYTHELPPEKKHRTLEEIVNSLSDKVFDIVYVSQKNENFIVKDEGLLLCEKIYEKYQKDLFLITRCVFNDVHIERLKNLSKKMAADNHTLFIGVSICGLDSYDKTENSKLIPTPYERILFLEKLKQAGVINLLFLRPIFPEKIIPTSEYLEIIDLTTGYISGIVTAGLLVTPSIAKRLNLDNFNLTYNNDGQSDYLVGTIEGDKAKMIDVTTEMNTIKEYCNQKQIPLFEHSLHAVEFYK